MSLSLAKLAFNDTTSAHVGCGRQPCSNDAAVNANGDVTPSQAMALTNDL